MKKEAGSDPAVLFDAIEKARKEGIDILLSVPLMNIMKGIYANIFSTVQKYGEIDIIIH